MQQTIKSLYALGKETYLAACDAHGVAELPPVTEAYQFALELDAQAAEESGAPLVYCGGNGHIYRGLPALFMPADFRSGYEEEILARRSRDERAGRVARAVGDAAFMLGFLLEGGQGGWSLAAMGRGEAPVLETEHLSSVLEHLAAFAKEEGL